MGNFFAELKRRHIYRVVAAYAVVAWLLLQLVNNVAPIMDAPVWVARSALLFLVLGFPIAIFFAWMRELPPADAVRPVKATVTDWALIGVLVVVIALVSYQQFAQTRSATELSGVEAARRAAAAPAGISIAVLPFVNLSGDAAQEFFSDGMTEEITSALAKVPTLIVIGRTSAFQFKGRSEDLRAIGQALSASYLIEGSVRKAGDRVRITAQLIRAETGAHLWAENYDRELNDVFAIQEDIAQAIAGALRVPLGLPQGATLVANRNIGAEAYQQYLRAKALVRGRAFGGTALRDAIALLESVVARNSDYAPAWAQLALAYALVPSNDPALATGSADELRRVVDAFLPRAEAAAQRAIQLDSTIAEVYSSLGRISAERGKPLLAEEYFSKALAFDPNNPDGLSLYGNLLGGVARVKEGLVLLQRSLALEPFVPVYNLYAAQLLLLDGQTDAAIAKLKTLPPNEVRAVRLAQIYAGMGRFNEAADALLEIPASAYAPGTPVEEAVRLLRALPSTIASSQPLPRLLNLDFIYLYVGAPIRVMEWDERLGEAGFFDIPGDWFYWQTSAAPVRKTERFKVHARKQGLVDYWRAKGWPEFCHPTTGDDFVCD